MARGSDNVREPRLTTLAAPPGMISTTRLLLASAVKRLPEPSIATPAGPLSVSPEMETTFAGPPPGYSTMRLFSLSAV